MRITLEIDDEKLKSIMQMTQQEKKSPAVATALDEFLRFKKRETFIAKVMSGGTDYQTGNEELEAISH